MPIFNCIRSILSLHDYSVEIYHPKFQPLWDDFVGCSKNGTFLFQRGFMDYHKDRFEDFSLLIFKKSKLVAVLPANRLGKEVHSHQGLTYGGLILPPGVRFDVVLNSYKALLQFLTEQAVGVLYIKQIPSIYHRLPSDEIEYLNFILDAKLYRMDTLSVVDNQSRLNFSGSRKEGVKRGHKHNLRIENNDNFELFWNTILKVNLKKKHNASPVHSLEEILYLKRLFPNHIKQYNVYHNEQLVAGTTIFETSQVAHCQYISGNDDNNILGSLDFLHDYLINKVYQKKRYFDFGTSNEEQGQHINVGLQFWKEGFGARTITQDFIEIDPKNHAKLKLIFK